MSVYAYIHTDKGIQGISYLQTAKKPVNLLTDRRIHQDECCDAIRGASVFGSQLPVKTHGWGQYLRIQTANGFFLLCDKDQKIPCYRKTTFSVQPASKLNIHDKLFILSGRGYFGDYGKFKTGVELGCKVHRTLPFSDLKHTQYQEWLAQYVSVQNNQVVFTDLLPDLVNLPIEVWNGNQDMVAGFIAGLFMIYGEYRPPSIVINLPIKKNQRSRILYSLQLLLLNFGIIARVHHDTPYIATLSFNPYNLKQYLPNPLQNKVASLEPPRTTYYSRIVETSIRPARSLYMIHEPIHHQCIANGIVISTEFCGVY